MSDAGFVPRTPAEYKCNNSFIGATLNGTMLNGGLSFDNSLGATGELKISALSTTTASIKAQVGRR